MARITWTLDNADGQTVWQGPDIGDPKMARIMDWIWSAYAPVVTDETSPNFGQPLPRNANREGRAFKRFSRAMWRGVIDNMRRSEIDVAVAAARDSVPDDINTGAE